MSVAPSTLPADWSNILDEMQSHLDCAIASVNERMERMPSAASESPAPARHEEIARWSACLGRLGAYLESAEQIVRGVDEVLHEEEARLRQELAACATVRQKLADGMGGAIG